MSKIRKLWDDDNEDWVLVDDSGTEYDSCMGCAELFPLSELSTLTGCCSVCEHEEGDDQGSDLGP
jgi:hypothetical protein